MSDTWIFSVVNFGADLLHCFGHPPRFDDRNNVVVGSMKDPDMRLANSLGCGQVALG